MRSGALAKGMDAAAQIPKKRIGAYEDDKQRFAGREPAFG